MTLTAPPRDQIHEEVVESPVTPILACGQEREASVAGHDADDGWDLIVTPWHLDERIPAFPVPVGAAETICPSLPDGAVPGRMAMLHRAVAGAVARAARPLVLSGDCPAALGVVAGLQSRYRDLAVVWLDAHGDFNTP